MEMSPRVAKFARTLPSIRAWIEGVLKTHRADVVPARSVAPDLPTYFPQELVDRTTVAIVSRVPFPPLSEMGLTEFKAMEEMDMYGVTYMDTVFIRRGTESPSLYLHEMVHVAQWDRLGPDKFLMVYGLGVAENGYYGCSMEQMAFQLQDAYERQILPTKIIELIRQDADREWAKVQILTGMPL